MLRSRVAVRLAAQAAGILLFAAFLAQQARAQEADRPGDTDATWADAGPGEWAKKGRSVGGHNFAEFRTVAWPFVSTRVASVTSVGYAEFTESPRALGVEFDGTFSRFREEFLLGLALTRWLGVELFFRGSVLGGINRQGALIVGANTGITGGGALVLRLLEGEKFYLSVRALGSATRFEGVSPVRVLDEIELNEDGTPSLSDLSLSSVRADYDGESYTGVGEIAGALGLNRVFGLQASARIAFREINVGAIQSEREGTIAGGLGLSLDLSASGLAAHLLAGGRVAKDFGDDVSDLQLAAVLPSQDFRVEPEVGLFYSGRRDLELGLAVVGLVSDDEKRGEASVRLGYFW